MTTLKRKIANAVEQLTGARIVSPENIGRLHGEEHIRRVIAEFGVDCVFDVGANAGQYAGTLRERVGYSGPIISFEPIPHLAQELRISAASAKNWYIQEAALDRKAGRARLQVTRDEQFSSLHNISTLGRSMFPNHVEVSEEVEVVTSTLAEQYRYWQELLGFQRAFLKIDTQGNDLAVSDGAGECLQEFVAVQVELAIKKLYEDVPDFSDVISFFQDHGFELSAFLPNNEGRFPLLLETDCIFVNQKYA
jgi:FkbM family methyltransferase